MRKVDFIIVGQGLAGSCLALELQKRNKKFIVIDKMDVNSASRIAAGVFNPITGRTNQPTWRATEIFDTLLTFYSEAEKRLAEQFLSHLPIYRPFLSQEEQMKWPVESNLWINQIYLESRFPETVIDPFGGIEINKSGFLNTSNFIHSIRSEIQSRGELLEESFDFGGLDTSEEIQYQNIKSSKIIFCDGIELENNPWFNWLPLRKLKGELLLVEGSLPANRIINRGIFSVPTQKTNEFLIGSTYQHDMTLGNTETGIEEIVSRSKKLFKSEFKILKKSWGHRPTTLDRRPFLGHHPSNKNVCVFNGLGTKGVSLAPFFAVHLANWLLGKSELDREVNIERYNSLYFKLK